MRDPVLRLAAVLALAGTAAAVSGPAPAHPAANPQGPPPGHTGGFGEPTCIACHIGNDVNAFGGSVRIEGLPAAYDPGSSYLLTIVMEAEETVLAGFQISARFAGGDAEGRAAGTFHPVDDRVAVVLGETGQPYAGHTEAGTPVMDSSGSSWTVEWVTPDDGTVVFHLAANSGNGDNSPLSDLVFVASATVEAAPGDAGR